MKKCLIMIHFGGKSMETGHPLFVPIAIASGTLLFIAMVAIITRTFPPKKPDNVGKPGTLSMCGYKPNCVCSFENRPNHMIAPLEWNRTEAEGIEKIETLIRSLPRVRVITRTDNYLHAEFTTLIFGFVDDVEFLADEKSRTIHLRSASRLGYSDLGANRSRLENLRNLLSGNPVN
jgi:uncharacterized protein (DUF1499 family)